MPHRRADFPPQFFETLASVAPIAIFNCDADGRVLYINHRWTEITGQSADESHGHGWANAIHPQERDRVVEGWRAWAGAGQDYGEYVTDCRVLRASGEVRYVRARVVPVRDNGQVRGHVGIVQDVTAAHEAEVARQRYTRRLEILAAIDRAILEARSPISIADAVVERVGLVFPATRVSLNLFDKSAGVGRIVSLWTTRPTLINVGAELEMDVGVMGSEVLEGRGFVVEDLETRATATKVDEVLFAEGIRSVVRVPLRTPAEVIGVLNISSHTVGAFDQTECGVAQEVADRLAVAITNARLFEEVQRTSARVAAMSKRLVEVQETERREIARELHDEIGQTTTALKLRVDLMATRIPPTLSALVDESRRLVDDLFATVRRMSSNLRPPLLDEFGLKKALECHFEQFTLLTGVIVRSAFAGLESQRFAVELETTAYRVVQASLTNVARHAGVAEAHVHVVIDDDMLVRVADRGVGFDPQLNAPGAGLLGVQERVALVGGRFELHSSPGRGTTVIVELPLQPVINES